jgi:hypothetical protein
MHPTHARARTQLKALITKDILAAHTHVMDRDALISSSVTHALQHGWSGYNVDDEAYGAPRQGEQDCILWMMFMNEWADALHCANLQLTAAIQFTSAMQVSTAMMLLIVHAVRVFEC